MKTLVVFNSCRFYEICCVIFAFQLQNGINIGFSTKTADSLQSAVLAYLACMDHG